MQKSIQGKSKRSREALSDHLELFRANRSWKLKGLFKKKELGVHTKKSRYVVCGDRMVKRVFTVKSKIQGSFFLINKILPFLLIEKIVWV